VRSYVMFSEWRIESPPAEVVPMAIVAGMGVIATHVAEPAPPAVHAQVVPPPSCPARRPPEGVGQLRDAYHVGGEQSSGYAGKADAPRCHTRASRTTRSTRSRSSRSAQQRTRTSRRLTPRCRT
jgi:hypothetical protein